MAFFMGMERMKSGVDSHAGVRAIEFDEALRCGSAPASFSTSLSRGPRHSALPIAPRPHWMPGTFGV